MERENYRAVVEMAKDPQQQEAAIDYLVEHFGRFLWPREHVLICFHSHEKGSLSWLMEQAVLRCNGVPYVWERISDGRRCCGWRL